MLFASGDPDLSSRRVPGVCQPEKGQGSRPSRPTENGSWTASSLLTAVPPPEPGPPSDIVDEVSSPTADVGYPALPPRPWPPGPGPPKVPPGPGLQTPLILVCARPTMKRVEASYGP